MMNTDTFKQGSPNQDILPDENFRSVNFVETVLSGTCWIIDFFEATKWLSPKSPKSSSNNYNLTSGFSLDRSGD